LYIYLHVSIFYNVHLLLLLQLNDTVYDIGFLMSEPDSYDPAFLLPLFSHLLEPGMPGFKSERDISASLRTLT